MCEKLGLDKWGMVCYTIQALKECTEYRGVEQFEARRAHNPEVVGSSPASATIKEPGIDTKSVLGLFFFIGMFFVCFGNILISKKGMQLF